MVIARHRKPTPASGPVSTVRSKPSRSATRKDRGGRWVGSGHVRHKAQSLKPRSQVTWEKTRWPGRKAADGSIGILIIEAGDRRWLWIACLPTKNAMKKMMHHCESLLALWLAGETGFGRSADSQIQRFHDRHHSNSIGPLHQGRPFICSIQCDGKRTRTGKLRPWSMPWMRAQSGSICCLFCPRPRCENKIRLESP
ncbi:hypothetical protein N658DRAFT_22510 [Parathielavia hyrcaniae]|uniref:Uncharacterized protein n=1 Tax=Parathielavia hyrcaniae TaxID=113614 RepID=A0AAN6T782_9PEZI|nr:hypothetical protein N658DRAFT_22510 [Parathielavia hyrcaniae]